LYQPVIYRVLLITYWMMLDGAGTLTGFDFQAPGVQQRLGVTTRLYKPFED
jgi:hypothetical protein